jgi:putative transposase
LQSDCTLGFDGQHRSLWLFSSFSYSVSLISIVGNGRRVLSWQVSITLEVAFCLDALEAALVRYGKPAIFNTDQGSQFTSAAFTGLLSKNTIAISMDGRGAWRDNVFVERLWRSVKYEEVYLRAYDSVAEARTSIARYFDFYNRKRPHSSLDARTPDQAYFDALPLVAAA